jgi:hypothetical protein
VYDERYKEPLGEVDETTTETQDQAMPNGKPGDHPATDLREEGYDEVFTPEIDAIILELHGLTEDYARFDPFGNDLNAFMLEARHDRSLWPELHQRLVERRAELASG